MPENMTEPFGPQFSVVIIGDQTTANLLVVALEKNGTAGTIIGSRIREFIYNEKRIRCFWFADHYEYTSWVFTAKVKTDLMLVPVAVSSDIDRLRSEVILGNPFKTIVVRIDHSTVMPDLDFLYEQPVIIASDKPLVILEEIIKPISRKALLEQRPFLFPIKDIFIVNGRGLYVSGQTIQGTKKSGDTLMLIGRGQAPREVIIGDIECYHKIVERVLPDTYHHINLRRLQRNEVLVGQVLTDRDFIYMYRKCRCELMIIGAENSRRHRPLLFDHHYTFDIYGRDFYGKFTAGNGADQLELGSLTDVRVTFDEAVAVQTGTRFILKEGGLVIGYGYVSKTGDDA